MCKNKRKATKRTDDFLSKQSTIYALINRYGVWEVCQYKFARGYSEFGEPYVWHFNDSDGCYHKMVLTQTTNHYVKACGFIPEIIQSRAKELNQSNNKNI